MHRIDAPRRPCRRHRRAVAALAAVLLVVAACTDREVTAPEPDELTQARLDEAVLDADDVPGTSDAGDGEPIATELLAGVPCEDDLLTALAPELESSRSLTASGMELTSTVAWFPDQGAAAANRIVRIRTECRQAVERATGRQVRTDALRLGALTDRVQSFKVELQPDVGPITELVVVVAREGDLLHVIRARGDRPVSRTALTDATRQALAKLAALAQDTGQ